MKKMGVNELSAGIIDFYEKAGEGCFSKESLARLVSTNVENFGEDSATEVLVLKSLAGKISLVDGSVSDVISDFFPKKVV
jgi:hypothetical protein